ncbi:MAG: ATP-binding cassette domain-containing protein [Desulfamplus sp.]|nr:ATP-binding cassette domain-containing protein [Desulfamplus sp.]
MSELFRRLKNHPFITIELTLASFFINFLGLASSLYIIQLLNRYVSHGVDSTLFTLTIGVCIAIMLELGFRRARSSLAIHVGTKRNYDLMTGTFGILTHGKMKYLDRIPQRLRQEIIKGTNTVEDAYKPANITAVFDIPFAFMFIGVITWISPLLSSITLIFMLIVFILGIASRYMLKNNLQKVTEASVKGNGLFNTVNQALDTVRLFDNRRFMARQWSENSEFFLEKRAAVSDQQDFIQSVTRSVQSIMSVAIYATGAMLAVKGELPVGTLIGVNVLAMRALGPISRFTQLGESFTMASQALDRIQQFGIIETERQGGVALKSYQGKIQFKDISFAHPGMSNPLFEALDLEILPGGVLVVTGENGTGKTTLCRLISGLLEPDRGQILADGVDIRQLSPSWWRSQLTYLPQDSQFLQGSIRENLEAAMSYNATVNKPLTTSATSTDSGSPPAPDASISAFTATDESVFTRVIKDAGLLSLIDQSPLGLDTQIVNNGANLSAGHRKRLALARALAVGGKLVLFDEPTEGLDKNGCATVYSLLIELSKKRYTMIIFTQDPNIIRGATRVLDLNSKPVPKIVVNHPNAGTDSHTEIKYNV